MNIIFWLSTQSMNIIFWLSILSFVCVFITLAYCSKADYGPLSTALVMSAFAFTSFVLFSYSSAYQYGIDHGISPSLIPLESALSDDDLKVLVANVEPCVADFAFTVARRGDLVSLSTFQAAQVTCDLEKQSLKQAATIKQNVQK